MHTSLPCTWMDIAYSFGKQALCYNWVTQSNQSSSLWFYLSFLRCKMACWRNVKCSMSCNPHDSCWIGHSANKNYHKPPIHSQGIQVFGLLTGVFVLSLSYIFIHLSQILLKRIIWVYGWLVAYGCVTGAASWSWVLLCLFAFLTSYVGQTWVVLFYYIVNSLLVLIFMECKGALQYSAYWHLQLVSHPNTQTNLECTGRA